jgi:hypothetical protein
MRSSSLFSGAFQDTAITDEMTGEKNNLTIPRITVKGELIVMPNDEWYPEQRIRITNGDFLMLSDNV